MAFHAERDAVFVEAFDVLAPRDHERSLAWTEEGQAGDARKHLARRDGEIGDGADLLAGGIDHRSAEHLRQIEHNLPLPFRHRRAAHRKHEETRRLSCAFMGCVAYRCFVAVVLRLPTGEVEG